ncbi:hypothetical protein BDW59DRAFT_154078 [Aspergillus cavernicola]|uniref:Uncharacterized protein n=1 Tax=Aspergillus cavernicola TaxID=176166 RepID=A0ABR4HHD5_9EURO
MEVWPVRHDSLHHHHQKSPSPPPPSFPLPSQSSPTLAIDPLAGYPGLLSLHNYRKILSQGTDALDGQEGKTLRRKNADSNLNQTTAQMGPVYQNAYYHPFAASSTTSSPPPPLSPSYSPSALSEQLPELMDGYGYSLPPLDASQYESVGDKQSSYKLLDTFRDRLEKFPGPDTPDIVEIPLGHSRARSDSVLFKARRARKKPPPTATVVHQGTSFEILNPHESLDFARIVSYIEDVDSRSARNQHRDTYHLSPDDSNNVIPEHSTWDLTPYEEDRKAHDALVGDSPHHPMPSISERLEEQDPLDVESCYSPPLSHSRPLSMIRPWTTHNESDLGEPGPPIFSNDADSCYSPFLSHSRPPSLTQPWKAAHNESNLGEPGPPIFCNDANAPSTTLALDPIHLAALYGIGHLPEQGKGTANPTAIIYSEHKPLRKKSTMAQKKRNALSFSSSSSSSLFSFSPSAAATVSAPLRRLRGIAQSLRRNRKTESRASLS